MPLEYDNSAFSFFATTFVALYTIPSVWWIISRLVSFARGPDLATLDRTGRSPLERAKLRRRAAEQRSLGQLLSPAFLINLVMLAACLWVGYSLMGQVFGEHHEIKEYDPFEVLGIERGSTDRQIKRAYRQLSLKYHPDKNPDDKEAEETFVKIARAYAALTDEVARANYEKYGNPDGRQSLQVAIGLPSWLLDKGTQELLLLFYLVVLVVAIPLGVWTWYRWSSKYGETAVLLETQQYIGRTLANKQGAAVHARDLAELISTAPEFRKDTPRRPDAEFTRIKRSLENVPGYKMKLNPQWETGFKKMVPMAVQAAFNHASLMAHLKRFEEEGLREERAAATPLRPETRQMLELSGPLFNYMLGVTMQLGQVQSALSVLECWARVTQAVWEGDSPLLQLPHVDPGNARHCGPSGVKDLYSFLHAERGKGQKQFNAEEAAAKAAEATVGLTPPAFAEEARAAVLRVVSAIGRTKTVNEEHVANAVQGTVRILEALPSELSAEQRMRVAWLCADLPNDFTPDQRADVGRVVAGLPDLTVRLDVAPDSQTAEDMDVTGVRKWLDEGMEDDDDDDSNGEGEGKGKGKGKGEGKGKGKGKGKGDGDGDGKADSAADEGKGAESGSGSGSGSGNGGGQHGRIEEGDRICVSVTIEREYMADGAEVPPVFCPRFPLDREEEWWVFLYAGNAKGVRMLVGQARVGTLAKSATEKIRFDSLVANRQGGEAIRFPRGTYSLYAEVKGNAYVGLDPPPATGKFTVHPRTVAKEAERRAAAEADYDFDDEDSYDEDDSEAEAEAEGGAEGGAEGEDGASGGAGDAGKGEGEAADDDGELVTVNGVTLTRAQHRRREKRLQRKAQKGGAADGGAAGDADGDDSGSGD